MSTLFVLFVVNLVEVLEWWLNKVDVNIIDLNRFVTNIRVLFNYLSFNLTLMKKT